MRSKRFEEGTFYVCHFDHVNDRVYAENVCTFLTSRRVPHQVIQFYPAGEKRDLLGALRGDAIGVLGFNSELDHTWIGMRNFLDLAAERGVPVIQWILDHPSARWPEFQQTTALNSRFVFLSPYSEAYFRRFVMPRCRSARVVTTGVNDRSRLGGLTRSDFLEREFSCILPLNLRRVGGTLEHAEGRLSMLPGRLRQAVIEAIRLAQYDLEHPIEHFFLGGDVPPELAGSNLFHQCIQIIEEVVQVKRRLEVFTTAKEYPVLFQSDILHNYLPDMGAAILDQGVSMSETFERMRRTRAVLSVTHANDEIHDRTVNALNAGAVNIIEDNVVHRHFFKHGKNALLFRYGDDSLRECLDLVCSHPERAYEIAEAGIALRDDPRLRFGGYDDLLALADADEGELGATGGRAGLV